MPFVFDKFREAGFKRVCKKTWEFYRRYLWWAFMGIRSDSWEDFEARDFFAYYAGVPAILDLLLLFLSCLYPLLRRQSTKQENEKGGIGNLLAPWHNRDLHILWLLTFFLMTFLAVCWEPISRLALPFLLINMAIGWLTYHVAAKQIFTKAKHSHMIASCLIVALMLPVLYLSMAEVYNNYRSGDWPYGEAGEEGMEAGKWLKENAPGSVLMFREPGEVCFYSEGKAIQIPFEELDRIIMVMKFYKVTHIIPNLDIRPSLKPLVEGEMPGLKLVYDGELKIYEIQYDLLPKVDLESKIANIDHL